MLEMPPLLTQILSSCRPESGAGRVSLAAVSDLLGHLDALLQREGFSHDEIRAMHKQRVQLPELGDNSEQQVLTAIDQGNYSNARKLLMAHSKSIDFVGEQFAYPYLHPVHKVTRLNDGHPRAIDLAARADFRAVVEKLLAIDYTQNPGARARKFIYGTNVIPVKDTEGRDCALTYQESFASAAAIYAERGDLDLATRLLDKHLSSPYYRETNFIAEGLVDFITATMHIHNAEALVIRVLEQYRSILLDGHLQTIQNKLATIRDRTEFTTRISQLLQ